jgi:hypothetical protein
VTLRAAPELPTRRRSGQSGRVSVASDLAELSTLGTQIDDLTARVLALAESYDGTPNAAIATELYAVERALVTARRTLDRAGESLTNLPG